MDDTKISLQIFFVVGTRINMIGREEKELKNVPSRTKASVKFTKKNPQCFGTFLNLLCGKFFNRFDTL